MAGLTNYAANKLYDHLMMKTAYSQLSNIWVGLFTAAPSDSGGGTEATGGSYARVSTAGADWNAGSSGSGTNANDIVFPTATASWGTVTHFGLFDASTAGNLLGWAALTSSKTVDINDQLKFSAGQLTVNLNAN